MVPIGNYRDFPDAVAEGRRTDVSESNAEQMAAWDMGRRRYAIRILHHMDSEEGVFHFSNVDQVATELIRL